jgi:hypothetical protein
VNALARFEEFVEHLFEGSLTQLLRSPVQPAEIAKRLERAMEMGQQAAVAKILVPTRYAVFLHPEDYAALESARGVLEREMSRFIVERAQERSFVLLVRPRVIIQARSGMRRRQVQVEAKLADTAAEEEQTSELEWTATLETSPALPPQLQARVHYLDGAGQACEVQLQGQEVTLGRARDNDVILDDPRVSRYHARIVQRYGQFVLQDLGSTYGTALHGQVIQESVLRHGDRLSLGGVELFFEEI